MKNLNRKVTIILAVILGILTGAMSYFQPLRTADEYVTNFIYRNNPFREADNRITLITIDEDTVAEYGSYDTWSRSLLADAVTVLSENNAAVIGLDLPLSADGSDEEGDAELVSACKAAGNVVAMGTASMDAPEAEPKPDSSTEPESDSKPDSQTEPQDDSKPDSSTKPEGDSKPDSSVESKNDFKPMEPNAISPSINWKEYAFSSLTLPYDSLQSAVSIGISNALQQSADGSIRNAAMSIKFKGEEYDSYAAAVYKLFKEQNGESYELPELDNNGLFGFTSIWNTNSYQVISFQDLIGGNYDASYLTDNIVLVGFYEASEAKTTIQQLRMDRSTTQEILVEAAIIQALLTQKTIVNINLLVQSILYGVTFTVIYGLTSRKKKWIGILLDAAILDGIVTACFFFNTAGYRMYLLTPILATIVGIITYITQQLIFSRLEKRKMERTLKMYVDSRVADTITGAATPLELAKLSERKRIAILFVDIRGFTSISETLEPEQVVEILNEYLTEVGIAIARWNGTLDKFIGDAAMAIFNAPDDLNDYVQRAACAAMDILEATAAINEKYKDRYQKEIAVGIGINCGDAIVGNIGSIMRMDYTAIGDAVNIASRLESKAKPGQILVSESVVTALGEKANVEFLGDLSLKGKSKTVSTYELTGVTRLKLSRKEQKKEELLNETRLLYSKIKSNL